jgi:hypothetical protein
MSWVEDGSVVLLALFGSDGNNISTVEVPGTAGTSPLSPELSIVDDNVLLLTFTMDDGGGGGRVFTTRAFDLKASVLFSPTQSFIGPKRCLAASPGVNTVSTTTVEWADVSGNVGITLSGFFKGAQLVVASVMSSNTGHLVSLAVDGNDIIVDVLSNRARWVIPSFADGEWHHVVASVGGGVGGVVVYVDGVVDDSGVGLETLVLTGVPLTADLVRLGSVETGNPGTYVETNGWGGLLESITVLAGAVDASGA